MKFNWGHGILVFFAIFFTLAAIFLVFAFGRHNDLETQDYYEKGANYSLQMEIDKRSARYSDSVWIVRGNGVLAFNVCEEIKNSSDSLMVHFYRPSNEALDYHTKLAIDSTIIDFDSSVLAHGRYEVKMNWQMDGSAYYLKKDLQVK